MAARPPTGGDDDSPDVIEFGIAALDARIEETALSFPATDDEVRRALGDDDIPYDARGRTIRLSEALAETDRERYDSENELLDALHPVFEAQRDDGPAAVLGHLRAMLPF
jgi:hypothetical protein